MKRVKILRPTRTLPFDGERLTTVMPRSQIEIEHFQRYFFALDFCSGKIVLDVACGEGYGASILSKSARRVCGLDCSINAVRHAQESYPDTNISFVAGRADDIPFETDSFDVIVSFETLEHLQDHEKFFGELKRVLRPGGILLVSTPDELVYSAEGTIQNPFHLHELTKGDFQDLLSKNFEYSSVYSQRSLIGTIMLGNSVCEDMVLIERIGDDLFSIRNGGLVAPYLVGVASDKEFTSPKNCVMLDTSEFGNIIKEHEFLSSRINVLNKYIQDLERIAHEREEAIRNLGGVVPG